MKIAGSKYLSVLVASENGWADGPVIHPAKGADVEKKDRVQNLLGGAAGQQFMGNGLLPFLCVSVLLLALAGCSSYEPKIHTGAKAAVMRARNSKLPTTFFPIPASLKKCFAVSRTPPA